jgi:hypothetical protein
MKLKALTDMTVGLLDSRHVSKGDVVEVPDDPSVVWPEDLWEPVKESKSTGSSKKEG